MRRRACLAIIAALAAACGEGTGVDLSGPVATWPEYGGNKGGERWSELDQITPENFTDLEIAWRWTSISTDVTERNASVIGEVSA